MHSVIGSADDINGFFSAGLGEKIATGDTSQNDIASQIIALAEMLKISGGFPGTNKS